MSDLPQTHQPQGNNASGRQSPSPTLPHSGAPILFAKFKFTSRISRSQIAIIAGISVAVIIFASITAYIILFGQKYQDKVEVNPGTTRQLQSGEQTFVVKKITLKRDGQVYEFNSNGVATKLATDGVTIKNRHLFSNDEIWTLFNTLTKEEFEAFITHYYSAEASYTIIIETSFGTKTIIVDDSTPDSPPPPDDIDDIIDDLDDLVDDVDEPPPSPPPTMPPTPTPSPGSTPTPPPSSTPSPTPTPSPGSTPAPVDPFRCDMLQNQINNVTVSNTVCVQPTPTP